MQKQLTKFEQNLPNNEKQYLKQKSTWFGKCSVKSAQNDSTFQKQERNILKVETMWMNTKTGFMYTLNVCKQKVALIFDKCMVKFQN